MEAIRGAKIRFQYTPRSYQRDLLKHYADGGKRGVSVWHRRAGKDLTIFNLAVAQSLKRVGAIYYFFPKYNQGRKIIWQGRDKEGHKFLDYIPRELIAINSKTKRPVILDDEMRVEFQNGSSIQIIGTDNMDSIVGTNPVGCIFSEYSLQNPRAWDLVRPILRENQGWAHFVYTPRGRNHGYRLFRMAQANPLWYSSLLTVRDTRLEDGTPVLSDADIQAEREEGMDEDLIEQEYYCSFDGSTQGSYYGRHISRAYKDERVTFVPWSPNYPVYTAWDLGIGDSTCIWFYQLVGERINIIDYYENNNEGLDHYKAMLHKDHRENWFYKMHEWPHDARQREKSSGISLVDIARKMGISPIRVQERLPVETGIQHVRRIFPRLWFDQKRCGETEYKGHSGLDCLSFYHKEWDEDTQTFKDSPEHDWSSHGTDAFRTLAMAVKDFRGSAVRQRFAVTKFDPYKDVGEQDAETEFDVFHYDRSLPTEERFYS